VINIFCGAVPQHPCCAMRVLSIITIGCSSFLCKLRPFPCSRVSFLSVRPSLPLSPSPLCLHACVPRLRAPLACPAGVPCLLVTLAWRLSEPINMGRWCGGSIFFFSCGGIPL
jgi:hypothetical protein